MYKQRKHDSFPFSLFREKSYSWKSKIVYPMQFIMQWLMNDFLLQDVEGKSPLHCAIENGHQEIINMLLAETGLELCSRDKSGLTPFATG